MRREKSLRIGVHHANGVVWGPVYRTHLVFRKHGGDRLRRLVSDRLVRRVPAVLVRRPAVRDARAHARGAVLRGGATEPRVPALTHVLEASKRLQLDVRG
jgi:hypothetical protein|eukprot:31402-Pelagococcus_subviridis.AAC.7